VFDVGRFMEVKHPDTLLELIALLRIWLALQQGKIAVELMQL
jgi:hypothetical protein